MEAENERCAEAAREIWPLSASPIFLFLSLALPPPHVLVISSSSCQVPSQKVTRIYYLICIHSIILTFL